MLIRPIQTSELDYINSRYKQINFKLSIASDYIVLALIDGKPAGQGRLVYLDENSAELGGIYVYPEFRGQGVAEKIVSHLTVKGSQLKTLYCLPFEPLAKFYKSFGFVEDSSDVHVEMKDKLEWCLKTYPDRTLLLQIKKGP